MENNELDRKIIEKVRNRIAISNLESEENMKLNKNKQVLSLVAVLAIMLTGSFVTVNATTNGKLVEKVKDTIKVVLISDDGKQEELKGTIYTDSNNHIIEEYNSNNNGSSYTVKVDKTNLDNKNLAIDGTIKDGSSSITIKEQK